MNNTVTRTTEIGEIRSRHLFDVVFVIIFCNEIQIPIVLSMNNLLNMNQDILKIKFHISVVFYYITAGQ